MRFPTQSELIVSAAEELAAEFTILDILDAEEVRATVIRAFTASEFVRDSYKTFWIWAYLKERLSVHDPEAWTDLDDFLSGRSFIMFFNYSDDKKVLEFAAGTHVVPILDKDQILEFYLTDRRASFLLCYNHEQFLLGCGTAMPWIAEFYR